MAKDKGGRAAALSLKAADDIQDIAVPLWREEMPPQKAADLLHEIAAQLQEKIACKPSRA